MSVTDLTGTSWVFLDDIETVLFDYYDRRWNINFTANNTNYTQLYCTIQISSVIYYGDDAVYANYPPQWLDKANKTITITDGDDVQDSDLINLIEQCAIPNVEYATNTAELTLIADAIRDAGDTSTLLTFPSGFITAISQLNDGAITDISAAFITENSSYTGDLHAYKNTTTGDVFFSVYSTTKKTTINISSFGLSLYGFSLSAYPINVTNVRTSPGGETINWTFSSAPFSIIGTCTVTGAPGQNI